MTYPSLWYYESPALKLLVPELEAWLNKLKPGVSVMNTPEQRAWIARQPDARMVWPTGHRPSDEVFEPMRSDVAESWLTE